jgi:DNA-directed RNA polymerase subunit M/transcription elongation factor TFIIS
MEVDEDNMEMSRSQGQKTFICPECGEPFTAIPPDKNHSMVTLDEKAACEKADGTVIKRLIDCEECGRLTKLYWYQERSQSTPL